MPSRSWCLWLGKCLQASSSITTSTVVKKCWEWCIELRFIGNIQCSYRVKCHIVAYATNHYDHQWLVNATGKREHGTCHKQNVIQPTMIALMTNVPSIQPTERDGTSACNLINFISLIIEGCKKNDPINQWCQWIIGLWTYMNLVGGLEQFLFFQIIGNNHPNRLSYLSAEFKPPTSEPF